jgi:hypothetical protein
MRKILIPVIAGALTVGLAHPAFAESPRADSFYVVTCSDGNEYEAVDAHSVELGGKSLAVELFSSNTPLGLECELIGPFSS